MRVLAEDLRPSQVITRESLENAIACVCASGGSTNGVLHLLAVAREAGIELDDRRLRADLAADAAARRPEARRPLRRHRPLPRRRRAADPQPPRRGRASCTRDAITVTGRTIGEEADDGRRGTTARRSCARSPTR